MSSSKGHQIIWKRFHLLSLLIICMLAAVTILGLFVLIWIHLYAESKHGARGFSLSREIIDHIHQTMSNSNEFIKGSSNHLKEISFVVFINYLYAGCSYNTRLVCTHLNASLCWIQTRCQRIQFESENNRSHSSTDE